MTVLKPNVTSMFLLVLVGCHQQAEADSFMDTWLARQKASAASSNTFNQDVWLSRQKAKTQEEWLAREAASQVASADSFNPDAWLARQAVHSDASNQNGPLRQDSWAPASSWEADEDLEQSLLSDIEEVLGKDHRLAMEGKIITVENNMQTMFLALPKNEYGKLGHPSVRYMLHRYFVEQHGWFIDGLFSEGAALNTTSPSHMLKDRVPMFVEGLFEKRLGGRGFGIHEMAVLVAVVEDSVHHDAQLALKRTYKALGLPLDKNFDDVANAQMLIEVYMSSFVMSTDMSAVSSAALEQQWRDMILYYPTWPTAQKFFTEVRLRHTEGHQTVTFAMISSIVKELVDTFGSFHGKQCSGLKQTLQGLQQQGSSGCVDLDSFYTKGLKADSNWMFVESPDYLRHIGVLDESNLKHPRLIAANYINSPTNCLQPSGYYMVCCHNECDDILSQLEGHIGQPSASPMEILLALRGSSRFGDASLRSGGLSPALRRRLEEVAKHHGGRVPIHGRLFAQWLHHVYPNECPYPHLSGSKKPQWMEDFEEETGKVSQFTGEEMVSFVRNASKSEIVPTIRTLVADAGSCVPWLNEEELFAPLPSSLPLHALENDPHVWYVTSGMAFLAALSTFMIASLRTCKTMYSNLGDLDNQSNLKRQPRMLLV